MEHENLGIPEHKPIEDDRMMKQIKGGPKKRTRRGYGKKNKRKIENGIKNVKFCLLGTNANGIMGKQESLNALINKFKANVITIQESKLGRQGLIKIKGYQLFEKVRSGSQGGGLITAVDQDLEPVLVSTGEDDDAELITVQIKVGETHIRIINAYGPQEDDGQQKILNFWAEIENEIMKSKENDCLTVLQMDANAKIGKDELEGDPHDTSNNGKLLLEIAECQNMIIANRLNKCKGVITR